MSLKSININAPEACSLESLPDNWVLISINQTNEELWPLKIPRDEKVLTVRFDDVTKEHDYYGKIMRPIDKKTALEILEFIEKNKEKNIFVNCAAGISRSSAVCLFIHRKYGDELKPNFWKVSHPNNHTLQMLEQNGEYKD